MSQHDDKIAINVIKTICAALLVFSTVFSESSILSAQTSRSSGKPQRSRSSGRSEARVVERGQSIVLNESMAATSLGGAALSYQILLPAGYATSVRRYPVLYLLHGADGDETDWLKRTNLSLYVARYHLIVVMPGVGNTWYANSASDDRARYEDVIVRDLIPHIDRKYRTLANWHGRGIAGLSMGGFGAVKFALRYPHLFIFAGSFSGAFDAPRTNIVVSDTSQRSKTLLSIFGPTESEIRKQNDVFELVKAIKEGTRLPYFYISTGSGDPLASVLPSNPRLAGYLRERKFGYEYHERPGSHNWLFWDGEIKAALERMNAILPQMQRDNAEMLSP